MSVLKVDLTRAEAVDEAAVSLPVVEDGDQKSTRLPDRAVLNDDGSVTLPLKREIPLSIKGSDGRTREDVFTTLTFHELLGADMRLILQAAADKQPVVTFARSTRLSQAVMTALFDKLSLKDINDGSAIVSFLSE